jgi:hypothetical protein
MSRLSDSQLVVLTAACQREDRCVFPVTAKLKGNAAGNVLKSLLKKDLIKEVRAKLDDTVWRHDEERGRMTLVATKAAFAALGIDVRHAAEDAEAETAAPVPAKVEAKPDARPKTPKSKEPKEPRKHSKQAQLIAMLRRIKGAIIDEIAEVLEWQPHTVRGAIAGALKKKLGLTIVSEKSDATRRAASRLKAAACRRRAGARRDRRESRNCGHRRARPTGCPMSASARRRHARGRPAGRRARLRWRPSAC